MAKLQMNFTKVNTNNLRELERLIKTENRNINNNSNNQMQLNYVNRSRMGVLLQFQGNANCGSCSGK